MTTTSVVSTDTPAKPVRRKRGEGQWALGYSEPLNKNERAKKDDNPLVHDDYPSIGWWPCTRRVAPGADPRSGRWAGTNKTECGIH